MAKKKATPKPKVAYEGTHYRILFAKDYEDLERQMDKMIGKSWKISGGLAVNTQGFYQAVYRD